MCHSNDTFFASLKRFRVTLAPSFTLEHCYTLCLNHPVCNVSPDFVGVGDAVFLLLAQSFLNSRLLLRPNPTQHDAQLDFYGRRLATASSDRTVRIFEVAGDQHTEIAALRGYVIPTRPCTTNAFVFFFIHSHEGPVWQSAWAHPKFGSLIASCSYDGRVIIWKEQSGQQQQAQHSQQYATNNGGWEKYHEHAGHSSSVNAVAWAPHELDCLMLACASSDGSGTLHLLLSLAFCSFVAFT